MNYDTRDVAPCRVQQRVHLHPTNCAQPIERVYMTRTLGKCCAVFTDENGKREPSRLAYTICPNFSLPQTMRKMH